MSAVVGLMRAVDVLDVTIEKPSQRKKTAPGRVPLYKFQFNERHHVTADEARLIVDAFDRARPIEAFLAARFPKFNASRADLVKLTQELAEVWTAFNRVAAANDGYTVG